MVLKRLLAQIDFRSSMGVDVEFGHVHLEPCTGYVESDNLALKNPKGYSRNQSSPL